MRLKSGEEENSLKSEANHKAGTFLRGYNESVFIGNPGLDTGTLAKD